MRRLPTLAGGLALALLALACAGAANDTEGSSTVASTDDASPGAVDTDTTAPTTGPEAGDGTDGRPATGPDLIIHDAVVVTVDAELSLATAVAIDDGEIVAVGDETVLAGRGADTRVVDLGGRSLIPGFVDPHSHAIQNQSPDPDPMAAEQQAMLEVGITTIGTPAVIPLNLDGYRAMVDEGLLIQRTHLYLQYNSACGDREPLDWWTSLPFDRSPDLRLAIAGVKLFTDGGSCRAPAVSFDYRDTTPQRLKEGGWVGQGDLFVDGDEVADVVATTDASGGLTVVHAIGDRGILAALDGIERGLEGRPNINRHRIDHNSLTSLLPAETLARYSRLEIDPVTFTMPFAGACDPATVALWQSILPPAAYAGLEDPDALLAANPGIALSWHSDTPFFTADPLVHMYTMITREALADDGSTCTPDGWDHVASIDTLAALRRVTINAAHAMDLDTAIGSIEVGKRADLAVLTGDILDPDPRVALLDNRVAATFVDGEPVFCHPDDPDLCAALDTSPGSRVDRTDQADETSPSDPGSADVSGDNGAVVVVRASAEHTPAAGAVDGDPDAGWVSGDGPVQWIELDLGEVRQVDELRLLVDQSPPGFTRHRILGGPYPAPTEELTVLAGETDRGDVLIAEGPWPVRYLRVETIESPSWVAWLEIEVVADH